MFSVSRYLLVNRKLYTTINSMLVLDFDQLFFRYGQERSDRGGGVHTPLVLKFFVFFLKNSGVQSGESRDDLQ